MSARDRLLDACEAAWMAQLDVPTIDTPEGLQYPLRLIGLVLERERPGLVDRVHERRSCQPGDSETAVGAGVAGHPAEPPTAVDTTIGYVVVNRQHTEVRYDRWDMALDAAESLVEALDAHDEYGAPHFICRLVRLDEAKRGGV